MSECFLITGGQGFFGAWIARRLLADGCRVVLFDLRPDDALISQVLDERELARVERVHGDITDAARVREVVEKTSPAAVIHLAGIQVPGCRADPAAGASVNVIGALNVFEAVRATGRAVNIVHASSAAVVGPPEDYSGPIPDDARHEPRTHYGVFKTAAEGCARVYWHEHGIPSVALRPFTVYGVGREIGITSGPTKAIKAAVLGREFTIPFSGVTSFDYVEDIAEIFVACARSAPSGARALNVRGTIADVATFPAVVDEIVPGAAERIRVSGEPLPLASDLDDSGLCALLGSVPRTSLREGVRRTVERFRRLEAEGRLPIADL